MGKSLSSFPHTRTIHPKRQNSRTSIFVRLELEENIYPQTCHQLPLGKNLMKIIICRNTTETKITVPQIHQLQDLLA